ncbi:MAG: alpha-E domain-containing protein [Saprospiraceae bacterium]|nr:alpha-E domain-containing protein [Saprospiraceae bacterium]
MLVRIAESLYWTGRYIKRAMYLAKFMRVQYFSTLDASMALNIEFTLRSILNMAGSTHDFEKELNEQEVLVKVGFDLENPASILSTIVAARENTRALRHVLSSEVWESTNVMYHLLKIILWTISSKEDFMSSPPK